MEYFGVKRISSVIADVKYGYSYAEEEAEGAVGPYNPHFRITINRSNLRRNVLVSTICT